MASRDEIVQYLNELLKPEEFNDMAPSGLQVPGAQRVTRITTGVSAQLELFERAAELGAEMVLVHHGLFWDFHPSSITPQMAARLKVLLSADINLVAYHLPLDGSREVGNNVLLCQGLGFDAEPGLFGYYRSQPLGVIGHSSEGVTIEDLVTRVEQLLDRPPLTFRDGPALIHRIGVVSGSASSSLPEAIAKGLDAFLTGEPAEHVMAEAREGHIHYIAAGHYNTETLGVRRLGDLIAAHFGVEHNFIDIPNPI